MSKEDVTQVSFVDTILQSPYSSVYQKPIRIMKVDTEGNQSVETTTTIYKSINEPVSIEKINQICENIIQEKMFNSISKIMSSISDQFMQMEQRMISYLETQQQDNLQSLEDKIFSEIQFQTEKQIEVLENHLQTSKDQIDHEINSRFIEIIQEEVRKALENIPESELQEVNDFNLDLSSCKIVDDYAPNGNEIATPNEILKLATEILSEYPMTEQENIMKPVTEPEEHQTSKIKRSDSYFIDENLLPDGSDMIFEDDLDFSKISDEDSKVLENGTEPQVVQEEQVATEPVATEPVVTEPVVIEQVITEPVVIEQVVTEQVVTEQVVTEPGVTEPGVTEPVVTEPGVTTETPVVQEEQVVPEQIIILPESSLPIIDETKIVNNEPSKSKKKNKQNKNKVFKTPKSKQVV